MLLEELPAADFRGAAPRGAWWSYNRGAGRVDVCALDAAAVTRRVRAAFGLAASPVVWDVALLDAIDAAVHGLGTNLAVWRPIAQTVGAERLGMRGVGAPFGPMTVRFALWWAIYRPRGLRFDAIGVDRAALLPQLDAPVGGDPARALVCWDLARQPDPTRLSASELSAAATESRAGIRISANEAEPPVLAPDVEPPAGVSWRGVAVAGVVLAALVGASFWMERATLTRRARVAKLKPYRARGRR